MSDHDYIQLSNIYKARLLLNVVDLFIVIFITSCAFATPAWKTEKQLHFDLLLLKVVLLLNLVNFSTIYH